MPLSSFELVLRAGTVAMLLMLAASLYSEFRKVLAGRLAIAFAVGSAAHAASYSLGMPSDVSAGHAPLIALSTGNVVVFWLFARALFDEHFRLRWYHGLIWAAVACFSLVSCLWIAPSGHARPSVVATSLITLIFVGLALTQTVMSWSADLVERRRRARFFIICSAALYGGVNALLQIFGRGTGDLATSINAAVLGGIVGAIAWAILRVDGSDLFAAETSPASAQKEYSTVEEAADQKLIDALMRLMADERIYRRENITIGSLALRLGIPEYRLRRLINRRLGYRNFNVFLNNHRIEEAKAALADPTQAEVPIITIAMDAGFQSLGPFNRAFKSLTGLTPSEYRRIKARAA
jgi:AraC-like DNA-binding protein